MRYIIILALVLCLAVSALAIPLGTEKSYIVDELNQLTTQTNTLRLLTRLNLSINQKAAIAPIVREQIQDKNAIIRLENSCSADYEIAIEKLRSAVIANNGVSEEIKQGVRNAQKLYKSMEEKLEKATPIRAEQIWNILNAEQKQIAVSQGIIAKKRNLNSNIVLFFAPLSLAAMVMVPLVIVSDLKPLVPVTFRSIVSFAWTLLLTAKVRLAALHPAGRRTPILSFFASTCQEALHCPEMLVGFSLAAS